MNHSNIDEIIKLVQNEKLSDLNGKILDFLDKIKFINNRLYSSKFYEQHDELKLELQKAERQFADFLEKNKSQLTPDYLQKLTSQLT